MAEAIAVVKSLVSVLSLCARVCQICQTTSFKREKDCIRRLNGEAAQLMTSLNHALKTVQNLEHKLPEPLARLNDAVDNCKSHLDNLDRRLGLPKRHAAVRVLARSTKDREMELAANSLSDCRNNICLALSAIQFQTAMRSLEILLASRLPVAEGASFDSHANEYNPGCHPNTQLELLSTVHKWARDLYGKPILWLNGMAGTGKSTVSLSLARHLHAESTLGASFFFQRGGGDRSRAAYLFTTIAAQLIDRVPSLAPHVRNAVEHDRSIAEKTLSEQFEKLILRPVDEMLSHDSTPRIIVIIVDGLDECDDDMDIRNIINLLPRLNLLKRPRLKFFLSSRPEHTTYHAFCGIASHFDELRLHDIPKHLIKADIYKFIKHELDCVRKKYNASVPADEHLPEAWPRDEDTQHLVTMSAPLFLFAATVCRFLADRSLGHPATLLSMVLKYQTRSQNALEAAYLPILSRLMNGPFPEVKKLAISKFRIIVGSIVSLANPLSTRSLSRILNIPQSEIDSRVDNLLSVLVIRPGTEAVVQVLHDSFREFLMCPKAAESLENGTFCIKKTEVHMNLAKQCIRILTENSRGCVDTPILARSSDRVAEKQHTEASISSEVEYACLYWVFHFKEGGGILHDGDMVNRFLQRHFLHWLDLLSCVERISESIALINELQELSPPRETSNVGNLLYDAKRFVLTNLPAIKVSPTQIYKSAILFAPKNSVIRKTFEAHVPREISLLRGEVEWGPCLKTLEGHHKRSVNCVAISHDNSLIASASFDNTIMLWNSISGVHRQTLEGHTSFVSSVAFSTSDAMLVSTSSDKTVVIWDVGTAQRSRVLRGHENRTSSAAFSHSDSLIVSGSGDWCVKIWDVTTGLCLATIDTGGGPVHSVAWAPDDSFVISANSNGKIDSWNASNGSRLRTYNGHNSDVSCAITSRDGLIMASGSSDNSIKLWDISSGACVHTIKGHSNWVNSISFSPDGKFIASASMDQTVKVWCVGTGRCLRTLKGHNGDINSVAFSNDGTWLASSSADRSVKIWQYTEGMYKDKSDNHDDYVNSLVFSPNGALLVSASDDRTIKVWSALTGKCLRSLNKHNKPVTSLAFSSDGRYFASASEDETIVIWHATGTPSYCKVLKDHKDAVSLVTFSHDSRMLASASEDNVILLWDCQSWRSKAFQGGNGVQSLALSRDGTDIAAASRDYTIKVWDTKSAVCRQVLQGCCHVNSITFAIDNMTLVSSSNDGTLRTWDILTGDIKKEIKVNAKLYCLSFDDAGSFLQTSIGSIPWDETLSSVVDAPNQPNFQGYALDDERTWITKDGQNFLWLPPQLRPWRSAIMGSTLAIGSIDGRVMIVQLSSPHKYLGAFAEFKSVPNNVTDPGLVDEHTRANDDDWGHRTGFLEPSVESTVLLAIVFTIGILFIMSNIIGIPRANIYIGISIVGLSVLGCVYLAYRCLVRSW